MHSNVAKFLILIITSSLVWVFTACDNDNGIGDVNCTTEFVTITLHVQNQDGVPVENVDITVTDSNSGGVLPVCEDAPCNAGAMGDYVIFHDGFMESVSIQGDPFEVTGEKEGLTFSENFIFGKDECHVLKKFGPDTVTIN